MLNSGWQEEEADYEFPIMDFQKSKKMLNSQPSAFRVSLIQNLPCPPLLRSSSSHPTSKIHHPKSSLSPA
jgi:hypothetical protein